ncbi:hypothetical protein Tfer_0958 [Thermincola ferriacetica]|uniref:Uncharacterized protein n=1 Tax=Thermincola ferriacetica TaxID=281456 RepID=A0A0L6W5M7_9FIRM|nr:hypothetical protein [Thermincola ferriacetica]KNZ70394.1 hypothetical protein Tfer_0958 [Thermincola ferriacetica]
MVTFWIFYFLTKGIIMSLPAIYKLQKPKLSFKENTLLLMCILFLTFIFGRDPIEGIYQVEVIGYNLLAAVFAMVLVYSFSRVSSFKIVVLIATLLSLILLSSGIYCFKKGYDWVAYGLLLFSSIPLVNVTVFIVQKAGFVRLIINWLQEKK